MSDEIRVLHVDDDREFAEMTATFLQRHEERFEVETAMTADEGRERLSTGIIDCVVSDYDLRGASGIDLLKAVRERYSDLPFILYTGKGSEEVASEAISAGVTDYLQKEAGTSQYAVLANRIRNAVERHRATDEAERRRYRTEQLLKTVPACVVRIDAEGRFTFANERARDVLGMDPNQVLERRYNDLEWDIRDVAGNPIPDEELPFRQVMETGEPIYGYRHSIEWPDGTRKDLQMNGAPLFDDDGSVESAMFALTDVTEELEQSRSNTLYRAVFEEAFDAILIANDEGEYIDANESATELFGLDRTDLLGQSIAAFAPEEYDFEQAWKEFTESDRERGLFPLVTAEGERKLVEFAATTDVIEGRHLSVLRDVTDRWSQTGDGTHTGQQLAAMLEHSPTPMFVKDAEGRYLAVNRGYRELFDVSDDLVLGLTDEEQFQTPLAEALAKDDRVVLDRGEPVEINQEVTLQNDIRDLRGWKVPIYGTTDPTTEAEPSGVFGIVMASSSGDDENTGAPWDQSS
ncbi:MAG: PAS domain-containing protein [Salinirussus sp.]